MRDETLFHEARQMPADERTAFLDEACKGDAVLRQQVDALLGAHDNPDSFLQQPRAEFGATVDQSPAELPLAERAGALVGPYKLLEQIGEGGMGVVYMAEQQVPIRRRVALKVIKVGMDTRQVIARFEAERQALALMDHSNIARVLDAGATDSGRPYFVMELVRGVPITEYCDRNKLPIHERLELFVQVCHAVQHAHQKGIIHRDIKPSNVLVTVNDGRPVPKVIDFGVAKATNQQLTEKTLFTAFAQMVGTPLYMSPEQAEMSSLDIDTRSDIYSLGVLLYELLTGTTPFDQERLRAVAYAEMVRIIREEEPPKPSTRISTLGEARTATAAHRQIDGRRLGQLVKGDLDWIVMKSMEKDRQRRYETANGLAADIDRYLQDEPVQACPPSAAYRFRKFTRRHKAAVFAACAVAATIVLLVFGLATSNRLISAERDQKASALKEKEQALVTAKTSEVAARKNAKRAEDSFVRASVAIREVLTKAAMGSGEWSKLPPPLRNRFSEEAVKFYETFLQGNSPDPDLQYEAGVGYRAIGTLHTTAGELPAAEKSFRLSIAILERLATQDPANQKYRHQWAWSLVNLGRTLHSPQQLEEGKNALQKGSQLYENLVRENPKTSRNELVTCDIELARRLKEMGDLKQAASILNRGIASLSDPYVKHSQPAQYNENLAALQLSLAHVLSADHRGGEAKTAFLAAAERFEDACSKAPNPALLFSWGECYLRQFDLPSVACTPSEREQAYREYRKIKSHIPDNLSAQPDLREQSGHMHRMWAFTLTSIGRQNEAEVAFVEAAKVFDKLTIDQAGTEKYWAYADDTHFQIANLMMQSGRYDEMERELRQAIDLGDHRAKFPPSVANQADRASHCNNVAWLLAIAPPSQQRKQDRAIDLAKRAVELQPKSSYFWSTLGIAQYRAGEWQPAIESLEKSRGLRNGGDPFGQFVLAMANWQLGHKEDARQWYGKAVEWMDKNQPKNDDLLRFRREAEELLTEKPATDAKSKKPD